RQPLNAALVRPAAGTPILAIVTRSATLAFDSASALAVIFLPHYFHPHTARMSNATQPLRIGLIGAGGNTRLQHIPGFRRCADVHIDLVANRSEASARKVA